MTSLPPLVSDFRSDTVTRPTPAMRRAMADAEVGDDVLDGDPTVRRLERAGAEWLGKHGALFVPSGTMANQVALGVWAWRAGPGAEVIAEEEAHVLLWESGALGALHGLQSVSLPSERGALDPDRILGSLRSGSVHSPRTALICVEQTHMGSGGSVVPHSDLQAIHDVARAAGVPVHMDGARLANAVVASGVSAAEFAACADSVSLCLSKGLGAPVGSLIAGDAEFLDRARVVRKRLGGWMRQSGVIAAAGLVALETGVERLAEDHALARRLAARLDGLPGLSCPPGAVQTNLVKVHVEPPAPDAHTLVAALREVGVGVLAFGPDVLRFIAHRDVGPEDAERVARELARILD